MAAAHDDDNDEFNTPHLPKRYLETIKAKKRQRLKKKLLVGCAVVFIIAILFILLNWAAGSLFSSPAASSPVTTTESVQPPETSSGTVSSEVVVNITPSFRLGAGLNPPLPPGVIALDAAVAVLERMYPAADYTIVGADLDRSSSRSLYEFEIQTTSDRETTSIIFIDAVTGSSYSPGEETAKILRDDAERRARAAFPALNADRCLLTITTSDNGQKLWEYTLYQGSQKVAAGTIDADSGEMITFVRIIQPDNRPAAPTFTSAQAQEIADRYIIDDNGGELPLNMSRSWYEPVASPAGTVAGQYIFVYERIFQDFPTDVDGFTVIVDAVNGGVIGYAPRWTTPEYAFFPYNLPDVTRLEATFAVMKKAQEQYPASIDNLRIISADIRWKNDVPYGTVPRPGSIPLAWKVVFDDDIIRTNTTATPAIAWVDVQSGEFIAFEYRH